MKENTPTPDLPVEMNQAAAATGRTKNTLTLPCQLRLARWCEAHVEACQTETYAKLAGIATATLEFTVTPANMSSTIEACDIERKKPEAPPSLEEQVLSLRKAGDEMLLTLRAVTARLNRLEMLEQERTQGGLEAAAAGHPELGLPVPAFGETGGAALPFDTDVRGENAYPVFGTEPQ